MKKNKSKVSKEARKFDVHRTLPTKEQLEARQAYKAAQTPKRRAESKKPKREKKSRWKKVLVSLILTFLAFVIVVGAWDWLNFSRATSKMFGSGNLFSLLMPSSLNGEDQGRVNVLLVGYSVDDPGHPASDLTDSLMLISMKTDGSSGYMLSIPRDLYVDLGEYGNGKINAAYKFGDMELLELVIAESLGVNVDYYALLNYTAFRDTVNALNGITIAIDSKDPRGLYDGNISPVDGGPLKLSNGLQNLDGQTALNLARARGSTYDSYGFNESDFTRTQHQRLMLVAIKDKATDPYFLLNPLKNKPLFEALGNNVKTDIPLSDVRPLYQLFSEVGGPNMQSLALNKINNVTLLRGANTSSGSSLVPVAGIDDFDEIIESVERLNNQ